MRAVTTRIGWWAALAAAALAAAVYLSLPDGTPLQSMLYFGVAASAALATGYGARRLARSGSRRDARSWWLIAASLALFASGDLVWTFYEEVLDRVSPFPSIADALYLGGYPALVFGVVRLLRTRGGGDDRDGLIDALLVGAAVAVPAWVFVMDAYVVDSTLSIFDRVVSIAYPLMDIVVLSAAVRLLVSPRWRGASFRLLTLGCLAAFVGDMFYAVALLDGSYYSGHPMDLMWIAQYGLIAAAALHPSAAAEVTTRRERRPGTRPLATYALTVLVVPATYALAGPAGYHVDGPVLVFGFLAVFSLVMIRTYRLVREVERQVVLLEAQRAEIEAGHARKASIFESALDSIVSIDSSGRIIEFNPAAEETFGYLKADVIGRRLDEALIPDRFRAKHRRGLAALVEGAGDAHDVLSRKLEVTGMRASGEEFPIELTITSQVDPVAGVEFTAFVRDISDTKRSAELEERLRQAQKMEALGRLAGGVAHEFNNLLAVILGHADFVRSGLESGAAEVEDVYAITKAGNRAADLVRQLLAFSRQKMVDLQVIDTPSIITGLEQMLRPLLREDLDFRVDLAPGLHPIEADPTQFEQVITNLVVNARDALPEGGIITVHAENVETDGRPHVRISVLDDGIGMSDEVSERAFEPFFTTKPQGEGTGLGLSMVYGVVERTGGSVVIESHVGRGTEVRMLLPAALKAPERSDHPVPDGSRADVRLQVLVVEDDPAVGRVVERMLRRAGAEVVLASSPRDAVELVREGSFDVVVSDVVMPQMSGPDMLRAMGSNDERPAAVLMSGYQEDDAVPVAGTDVPLLAKPFTQGELIDAIAHARRVCVSPSR